MIELVEVSKQYGNKRAVDRLSLAIPQGELFAFLGPNGAGKTTTIKMLCGLLFPTAGQVRVGGYDLATAGDAARRLIAFVPDTPYLYEKLTGREFLQFIGDMYGLDRATCRRKSEEVIGLFHLADFVDDLTERYSHGMRQRTVFAGALLHEPSVLIVDEPTVGLDPKSIRLLKDLLRKQANGGSQPLLEICFAESAPTSSMTRLAKPSASRCTIPAFIMCNACGATMESRRSRQLGFI